MNMKGKVGSREDRIQIRLTRMVKMIAFLETKNDLLEAEIEEIHEAYEPVIGKLHRMYCLPSQADKTMVEVLDLLADIEKKRSSRNGN